MPPSPALSSWDTPFLVIFERGPCAAPMADWGHGRGWERETTTPHLKTQCPQGAPSQLPAPWRAQLALLHPRGGVKPTFIGGLATE